MLLYKSTTRPSSCTSQCSNSPANFLNCSLIPAKIFPPKEITISGKNSFTFFGITYRASMQTLRFKPSSISMFDIYSTDTAELYFLKNSFKLSCNAELTKLLCPHVTRILFAFFSFSIFSFHNASESSKQRRSNFVTSGSVFTLKELL